MGRNIIDVSRTIAGNLGSAFAQVITGAQGAAEAFKQAFLNAIGSIVSRLIEMLAMQVIGSYLPFAFLNRGGEIPRAARGLEITGGYRNVDSVPALVSRGEVVTPSPTVSRLNAFLDRMDRGAGGAVVNVNPLFFAGSKSDAYQAADYVRRRLEVQERFVIEGAL